MSKIGQVVDLLAFWLEVLDLSFENEKISR